MLGYVFGALVALYVHHIAAIYLAVMNLLLVLAISRNTVSRCVQIPAWLVINLFISLIYLPYFTTILIEEHFEHFQWLAQWTIPQAMGHLFNALGTHMFVGALTLSFLGVYAGILALWHRMWVPAAMIWGLGIVSPIVIYFVGFYEPILVARTLIPTLIGTIFGLAVILTNYRQDQSFKILVGIFLGLHIISTALFLGPRQAVDGWSSAVRDVATTIGHESDRYRLIVCHTTRRIPLHYYASRTPGMPETFFAWENHPSAFLRVAIDHSPIAPIALNRHRELSFADYQELIDGRRELSTFEQVLEADYVVTFALRCGGSEQILVRMLEEFGFSRFRTTTHQDHEAMIRVTYWQRGDPP